MGQRIFDAGGCGWRVGRNDRTSNHASSLTLTLTLTLIPALASKVSFSYWSKDV
jgi:hypothetical protein